MLQCDTGVDHNIQQSLSELYLFRVHCRKVWYQACLILTRFSTSLFLGSLGPYFLRTTQLSFAHILPWSLKCIRTVFTVFQFFPLFVILEAHPKMEYILFLPQKSAHIFATMSPKINTLNKTLHVLYVGIHSLCSIVCWCTFGNNYSLESSWIV